MSKVCSVCSLDLPFEKFTRDNTGEHREYCVDCKKDFILAQRAAARQVKFEKARKQKLGKLYKSTGYKSYIAKTMEKYGFGEDELLALLVDQEYRCPICDVLLSGHDSQSYPFAHLVEDQVNAFLCPRCTHLIHYAGDDGQLLDEAAKYVRKYKNA